MKRTFVRLGLLALVALAIGAASGCAKKLLPPAGGNKAPETSVFIQTPVGQDPDTVNHVVHLYWYGNDEDGYVKSFRVKLVNPADPVAADSEWVVTTAHDTLLTIYTPTGYTSAYFRVAAVDDKGAIDPTPALQRFQFNNQPPVLKLVTKPLHSDRSDTSFASVTVTWSISDPDGDPAKVKSYVWLDRMTGPHLLATGTTMTVPSEAFKIGGVYTSSTRTLYIQGVDDGGMLGPVDSVTWYVRQPVAGTRARVLFIDEQFLTDAPFLRTRNDTIYMNAVARLGVPASQTGYIWLSATQPIKSDADLYQTCKLFESVVWFRGSQPANATFSSVLLRYRAGLGRYLDEGGKVYLESQNMVAGLSSQGPLDKAFADRYLNCDGVFQYGSPPDSSAAYSVNNGTTVYAPTFGTDLSVGDSTRAIAIVANLRAFRVRSASQVYLYAKTGTLNPPNPIPMPIAINVPQASGGRIIANTMPLITGNRSAQVATNIMRQLGLDLP